jgi:alpha-N-acetylglucosamine transferase
VKAYLKYVQGLYPKEDSSNLAFQRLVFAWTKLRAFDITNKCVFLDCDMIVLQNLDQLLQLEDNPDNRISTNCPYTYNNNLSNIDERSRMFNNRLFVFHPNKNVYHRFIID